MARSKSKARRKKSSLSELGLNLSLSEHVRDSNRAGSSSPRVSSSRAGSVETNVSSSTNGFSSADNGPPRVIKWDLKTGQTKSSRQVKTNEDEVQIEETWPSMISHDYNYNITVVQPEQPDRQESVMEIEHAQEDDLVPGALLISDVEQPCLSPVNDDQSPTSLPIIHWYFAIAGLEYHVATEHLEWPRMTCLCGLGVVVQVCGRRDPADHPVFDDAAATSAMSRRKPSACPQGEPTSMLWLFDPGTPECAKFESSECGYSTTGCLGCGTIIGLRWTVG